MRYNGFIVKWTMSTRKGLVLLPDKLLYLGLDRRDCECDAAVAAELDARGTFKPGDPPIPVSTEADMTDRTAHRLKLRQ